MALTAGTDGAAGAMADAAAEQGATQDLRGGREGRREELAQFKAALNANRPPDNPVFP